LPLSDLNYYQTEVELTSNYVNYRYCYQIFKSSFQDDPEKSAGAEALKAAPIIGDNGNRTASKAVI
jgi:hypothetical protein